MKQLGIYETAVFMHDGAPPHFSDSVRLWLNKRFPGRWIGRVGDKKRPEVMPPIIWPPYSPDLTPCDFYLWGTIKDSVYRKGVPANLRELRERIESAFEDLRQEHINKAVETFRKRLELCVKADGGHIE